MKKIFAIAYICMLVGLNSLILYYMITNPIVDKEAGYFIVGFLAIITVFHIVNLVSRWKYLSKQKAIEQLSEADYWDGDGTDNNPN